MNLIPVGFGGDELLKNPFFSRKSYFYKFSMPLTNNVGFSPNDVFDRLTDYHFDLNSNELKIKVKVSELELKMYSWWESIQKRFRESPVGSNYYISFRGMAHIEERESLLYLREPSLEKNSLFKKLLLDLEKEGLIVKPIKLEEGELDLGTSGDYYAYGVEELKGTERFFHLMEYLKDFFPDSNLINKDMLNSQKNYEDEYDYHDFWDSQEKVVLNLNRDGVVPLEEFNGGSNLIGIDEEIDFYLNPGKNDF